MPMITCGFTIQSTQCEVNLCQTCIHYKPLTFVTATNEILTAENSRKALEKYLRTETTGKLASLFGKHRHRNPKTCFENIAVVMPFHNSLKEAF